MTGDSSERVKNAVWLTAHCRMAAEKRHRTYENVSSFLLSWLSLAVITWAVIRDSQHSTALLDTYTAIISVFVFGFSLITFGFRFGEVATLHRECYLRLQKLHDTESDPVKLTHQYHEILGAYANHSERDFDMLVLERTLFTGRKAWGADGKELTWTLWMVAKCAIRAIAFWAIAAGCFALGSVPYLIVFKFI